MASNIKSSSIFDMLTPETQGCPVITTGCPLPLDNVILSPRQAIDTNNTLIEDGRWLEISESAKLYKIDFSPQFLGG